ncbi:hypothetical protein E6W39_28245 [Kitasatospora acidiphila]|uniref:Uncharacterized protein n=1 Tax=Kitasatospora acidiphila TaxID=2567942 RepID=A0A540W8T3_9ACTN|nr:hypothetical protein [Kitasatospora acidiphila]TQF05415.1 hypothetical protein E6W39_28245 [Kitasatospora acidiphila]
MNSSRIRVRLRLLLDELGDLAPEIDPFASDRTSGLLYPHIATLADTAAGLARDLETDAKNEQAENGEQEEA